ncbi:MAG: endonuclease, partial [Bacteroidota bacterium]
MKKILQLFFLALLLFISLAGFGQIPSGYYNAASGKTGSTLRTALQTIITTGHVKLPYTSTAFDVWDAYAFTDVTSPGGNTIWDMYSDVPGGTPAYTFTLYTEQCGTASAEGDCYSREHQMPNSWWGGTDVFQYSDLHHLPPADQYTNNYKSAHPIGRVTAPTWTSTNGSKVGPCSNPGYTGTVFEPVNDYKGDFARAYLYLATRYNISDWVNAYPATEGQYVINSSGNTYKTWFINMLMEWHYNDPVSQKEIDRNNAIYYNTPQHNRNPFIDHPEYVCLIWGTSCVTAPAITNVSNSPLNPTPADVVNVSADITDNGSILTSILYWDVTPGTFSNSISMTLGTAPTYTTSSAIPAQVAGTTVYYKIVATDNESNSTTSDVYNYNIPQGEPDNHPTVFTCGTTTSSSIPLTWIDAVGTIIPNGYLIKMSSVSLADITNPSDGIPVADGTNAKNILPGVQTCTFTGLASSITYYFKIYAYSNSGSNINYKLIGTIQNTSCNTAAGGGSYACLTEGFDGGITPPSGWVFTNIGGTYITTGNFGVALPSLKFDATGDQITTPTITNPTELKLWIKGQGTDAASAFKIEGYNGTTWIQVDNITNSIPTTATTKTYNSGTTPSLTAGFTQFRFTYTKSVGNLSFDDVNVTCGGCTAPTNQSSGMLFNTITSGSMIVSWTRGNGNNVLVLAKAGTAVNSDPVSGVPYADSDIFGSGDQIGTGNYVVYNGPATSVEVLGLSASTAYYFAVYEYNNTEYCYKTPGLTGSQSTSAPLIVPSLTTNSASAITITTATSGGNITADGGSPVTARGVCWNNTGSPTTANSKTSDGTGTGSFVSSITGLTGGTTYYVRAYATNANGTSYGNEELFATLRAEPSNHPTVFSCGTTTTTTIPLSWSGATGSVLPHGYLIKASMINFGSISNPVDGVSEADDAFVKNVVYGINTCTFTGLNSNTTYYFKIYSYTNSNTDINYKTDGTVQSTSCTTVAVPTTIVYQGFESNPQDTWNNSGGASNSSSYKYVGTYSRRINSAQTVTFNNISLASYSSVNLSVAFSGINVSPSENLYLDISYDNGSTWNGTESVTLVNCNQNYSQKNVAFGATSSNKPITVNTNPWIVSIPGSSTQIAIRLRASSMSTGTYYIDDIKLTGILSCTYPTAYNVTGGGSYCSGGSGVTVGLDDSDVGINYQLMLGASPVGSPVAGTGSAISFGLQTAGGTYFVTGTNTSTSCSSNMNGTAVVTVNSSLAASVSISANPSVTVCPGTNVTYTATVTNGGITPTYQWKKNGSDISGETNSAYTETPINGDYFLCVITSNLACVTGSPATSNTLTMSVTSFAASVSIAVSPSNTICAGTNVTFTATPNNGGTPTYQWKKGGTNISGETNSTYSSAVLSNGDIITCVMASSLSCATGSPATSNTVTMTVNATNAVSVNIAAVPGGEISAGTSVTFTATPTNGGSTPSYQWKKNGSNISGETNSTFTSTSLANGDIIVCVMTSNISCPSGSPATSNSITMTVTSSCSGGSPATVFTETMGTVAATTAIATHETNNGFDNDSYTMGSLGCTNPGDIRITSASSGYSGASGLGNVWLTLTNAEYGFSIEGIDASQHTSLLLTFAFRKESASALPTLALEYSTDGTNWNAVSYSFPCAANAATGWYLISDISIPSGAQVSNLLLHWKKTGTIACRLDDIILKGTTNPYPAAYNVTGGGSYCSGGSGVAAGVANSQTGMNYQLKVGGVNTGSPVAGTGSAISFGNQTSAGTYTVVATNTATNCTTTMAGSATITINALPISYSITGGGSYCTDGSGTAIGLNNSESNVNYQLKVDGSNTGSPVGGTGSSISFGNQTTAGTYTVVATNTITSCTNTMTGNVSVSIDPLPTAYNVTGGCSYCTGGSGVSVGLDNSQSGVNYQLKIGGSNTGSPVAGTGSAINFGYQTTAGTYTVVAVNASTSCTNTMTGSVSVTINSLPIAYIVTGGGSLCNGGSGLAVGLDNSQSDVNYQLQLNGSPWGSPVAGTGSSISFGTFTIAGTYTVIATHSTTGCVNAMTGNATITVNPNPTPYGVTGGGSYCSGGSGVAVGLSNSESGVNYQLKIGGLNTGSPVAGTGSSISFGNQSAAGTYTVSAANATTGCNNSMTGNITVSINALPVAYNVTGGGMYCNGGDGVDVGLDNSETGVNYQLKADGSNTGSPVAGTSSAIGFGLQTAAGSYTVIATNSSTSCASNMSGNVTVAINSIQPVASVSNTSGCGTGDVTITSDQNGTQIFDLCDNGGSVLQTWSGNSNAHIFSGLSDGTYKGKVTFGGCVSVLSSATTLTNTVQPVATSIATPGCGSGTITITSDQSGVQTFDLCNSGGSVLQSWTGNAISRNFSSLANGTYYGKVTLGSCMSALSSGAALANNSDPTAYTVSGGGFFCSGGSGVPINLSNSSAGIEYWLRLDGADFSSPIPGTGSSLNFGNQTTAGTFTVRARNTTTLCENNMTGNALIDVVLLPAAFNITGGGSYCFGGSGVAVGLDNSEAGVNYQLQKNGVDDGVPVAGTGSAISFGDKTAAGIYTVTATNTTTSCTNTMNGSVNVSVAVAPAITDHPDDMLNICWGGNTSFGVTATGEGLTYLWQVNKGAGWLDIPVSGTYPVATTNTLSVADAGGLNGYIYRCIVSGTCTPACTSGTATLTVVPPVLTSTDVRFNEATLNWSTFCGGATGYKVRYTNTTTGNTTSLTTTGTSVKISGLTANIYYTWQVSPNYGAGYKSYSDPANFTTANPVLTTTNIAT